MEEIRETGNRLTVQPMGEQGLPEFRDVMWDTVTWLYLWNWNEPDNLYDNATENAHFCQNQDLFAHPPTC